MSDNSTNIVPPGLLENIDLRSMLGQGLKRGNVISGLLGEWMDPPEANIPDPDIVVGPERDENFKRWFGDSKVVDDEGRAQVVYHHGQFDETDAGIPDISREGMHFGTKDAAQARAYGKISDDLISSIEVEQDEDGLWYWMMGSYEGFDKHDTAEDAREAAMDEAIIMADNEQEDADDIGIFTKVYLSIKNPKYIGDQGADWTEAIQTAKKEGHDGIIYRNRFEDKGSKSYIVFSPTQIKSVHNRGTFNPDSPDILASRSNQSTGILGG